MAPNRSSKPNRRQTSRSRPNNQSPHAGRDKHNRSRQTGKCPCPHCGVDCIRQEYLENHLRKKHSAPAVRGAFDEADRRRAQTDRRRARKEKVTFGKQGRNGRDKYNRSKKNQKYDSSTTPSLTPYASEFVPTQYTDSSDSEGEGEIPILKRHNVQQSQLEKVEAVATPTPEVAPFDPAAYVQELSAYLFLERDPVPMSKVETVHPLPRGAEDLTLKQFVRKQNEFQLITVQGQVCVTNTPEHIRKQLKAGIEAPLEYWQSKSQEFQRRAWDLGCPLFDETAKANDYRALPEWAEVGVLQPSSKPEGDNFFINTHEPFCGVTIGVQGAGKSHTTNVIIENCMINHAKNELHTPMSTVVFHYDECPDRNCENVTLTIPAEANGQAVESIVILCSPSNFKRRKKAYRRIPNCTVHPLLFDFEQLSSSHLKKMMGVGHNDNQLYMQKIITDLRQWEKMGASARSYKDFKRNITERNEFASGQSLPLNQRLEMLESFLVSSPENFGLAQMCEHKSPADYFKPGTLVVVDLVDPFIDQRAANNIFQVILSMYIEKDLPCGKLTVFDEAHKYMDATVGNLCHDIVRLVRQMRHYGIRTLVSTQNPTVLHSELLELCSFAFLHRFHSPDWFKYLQAKLQLPKDSVPIISNLKTGEAIVYSSRSVFSKPSPSAVVGANLYRVLVKERVTRDCGATTLNAAPTS